jgi:hypothetical protein
MRGKTDILMDQAKFTEDAVMLKADNPDIPLGRVSAMTGAKDAPAGEADIRHVIARLLAYCEKHDWAGFDPYDGLNSKLVQHTPLRMSKCFRLAFTQVMKRLPLNLRPLLLVSPERNPKAVALFMKSLCKLAKIELAQYNDWLAIMVGYLIGLRAPGTPYWCWGYSFPWQTRTELVPKGAPNLICTSFVADALLDAYERTRDARMLEMALSAAEYIASELYWTEGAGIAGFSYPFPHAHSRVHNANYLGAALLCRSAKLSGEKKFLEPALSAARYSSSRQHDDGSWDYGESPTQRWIDNFHTGYNLCALRAIGNDVGTGEFATTVQKGLEFYVQNFFADNRVPKYFHDKLYPVDIHSVAQSIITLVTFGDVYPSGRQLARAVFQWAMENMWDPRGYFYYQVWPHFTNRISYMRWSQAWMLLALSDLHESDQALGIALAKTNSPRVVT